MSRVLTVRDTLYRARCLENVVIVAAEAGSSPGAQYLAPYAGATIAESLCEPHGDALVAYDDLTKHADAYRQLARLLGRPTGREAFPGDIFYVHSELLERATAFADGRTVTALPIVETTESDISAYIPTNLISITDGQLYLDTARFERNERPAVDVGQSVSRIGAAAQPKAVRAASQNLRVLVSRFESLEALTRVGFEIEQATRKTLERGATLRSLTWYLIRAVTHRHVLSPPSLDGVRAADARGQRAWRPTCTAAQAQGGIAGHPMPRPPQPPAASDDLPAVLVGRHAGDLGNGPRRVHLTVKWTPSLFGMKLFCPCCHGRDSPQGSCLLDWPSVPFFEPANSDSADRGPARHAAACNLCVAIECQRHRPNGVAGPRACI